MHTISPISLKNLRPPKLGERRNPRGRPKSQDCLLDCIKKQLKSKSLNGITTKEQMIASALVDTATKGNLKAIEILMTYTSVKPTQSLDLTTKGDKIGNGHIDIPEQHFADALVILAKSGISKN